MKSDKLEIEFSQPMAVFFAGQTLRGVVTLENRGNLKMRGSSCSR